MNFDIPIVMFLFTAACSQSFAWQKNVEVSGERAKELGVTIRSKIDGENGVKVKDFIELEAKKSADVPPVYETVEQIRAMSPCHAMVERRAPCYALFTATGGTKFYLGSPGATRDVSRFLSTLQVGQTYEFPAAFIAYQQKQQ